MPIVDYRDGAEPEDIRADDSVYPRDDRGSRILQTRPRYTHPLFNHDTFREVIRSIAHYWLEVMPDAERDRWSEIPRCYPLDRRDGFEELERPFAAFCSQRFCERWHGIRPLYAEGRWSQATALTWKIIAASITHQTITLEWTVTIANPEEQNSAVVAFQVDPTRTRIGDPPHNTRLLVYWEDWMYDAWTYRVTSPAPFAFSAAQGVAVALQHVHSNYPAPIDIKRLPP